MAATTVSLTGTMANISFRQPTTPIIFKNRTTLLNLKSNTNIRNHGVTMKATYNVTLVTPKGTKKFKCPDNVYILDQAEQNGINLPSTCLVGGCSSCVGKLVSGKVDQSDGFFLDDHQKKAGWVLTCVAYPKSDVTINTHKEHEFAKS